MEAIPKYVPSRELDRAAGYVCPLCEVQSTSSEPDIGWVYCPMLDDSPICLGCCIDHQTVARSDDFDGHAYRNLFDDVSQSTGEDVLSLRRVCLQHQESIVTESLDDCTEEAAREELAQLQAKIQRAKKTLRQQ